MENKNKFYVGKEHESYLFYGYSYDTATGNIVENAQDCFSLLKESTLSIVGPKRIRLETNFSELANIQSATILMWGTNDNYLGFQNCQTDEKGNVSALLNYDSVAFIAVILTKNGYAGSTSRRDVNVIIENEVFPHYKEIKKAYKKENGQAFFRESLDGRIKLHGTDYERIKNASINDMLSFCIYRGNSVYASAQFNKSDCKFDDFKKSVELKLQYKDKYSKILDAYDNKYDLIKLTPEITPLTLTKRCIVQIYVQGENVVSSYSGGTYWETEVDEQINDEDLLRRKYYFAKGPTYSEVNLIGFNHSINAAYRCIPDSDCWNTTSINTTDGIKYKKPCCIKFTKEHNAGDAVGGLVELNDIKLLSTGSGSGVEEVLGIERYKYDTYRIEIYDGINGEGLKLYKSDYIYGKDTNFVLKAGNELYPMRALSLPVPYEAPDPNYFYLGEQIVKYQIWGRLLCDVEQYESEENGQTVIIQTYDLPKDDFATPRRNYRRCIGLTGFNENNSVVKIYQSQQTSESPTPYGINDFGEYFIPPFSMQYYYYFPLARNSWANTSMWVVLDETLAPVSGFEHWSSKTYKEYTLKNSYHIAHVIKALLTKIDPSIKHEKTSEYSQFLYGHTGASAAALGECDLYITQKTNILKGEYDQAAQRAEIEFKQVMDMLRDCFRCYWFIDDQNRFRIEHISYFMNGLSYSSPVVQFNLTEKKDKFNKKNISYCQQELEYDKSDLTARYEFAWMDDVTNSMGNLEVDINDGFIQKDKTEEINIDCFTADIDYMLFLPNDFSNDGFALMLADENRKVPIVHSKLKDESQIGTCDIYTQNWYASFNQLIYHYLNDMPGYRISYNNLSSSIYVNHIKRSMEHNIEFVSSSIDTYKLITTEKGNGFIENVAINIDTDLAEVELRYEPS